MSFLEIVMSHGKVISGVLVTKEMCNDFCFTIKWIRNIYALVAWQSHTQLSSDRCSSNRKHICIAVWYQVLILEKLQAAASAAALQKEKIDVGGLQTSMFDGGISRFGCLERPGSGFSSICIDLHWFPFIFIDFHGFGKYPKLESFIPCGAVWRPPGFEDVWHHIEDLNSPHPVPGSVRSALTLVKKALHPQAKG